MERVRTWTILGATLLCVSALGCQEDNEPLVLRRAEPVEIDDAASGAADAGTATDEGADAEPGRDSRGEGRSRDEDAVEPERGQGGRRANGSTADEGRRSNRGDPDWRPSDAQIGKLLSVANKAEIDQANVALPKLSDARVRAFAERMIQVHSAAQTRQSALLRSLGIEPIASVLSSNLEYEASGVMARLEKATSGEIGRLFIDSQVTLHSRYLDTLEELLLPNAQDSNLWTELSDTRDAVRTHLDEAEALAEVVASTR